MLFNSIVGFIKLIKLCGCWCTRCVCAFCVYHSDYICTPFHVHTQAYTYTYILVHIQFFDILIRRYSTTYNSLFSFLFLCKEVIDLCSSYLLLILYLYFNILNSISIGNFLVFSYANDRIAICTLWHSHYFKCARRRKEDAWEK